MRASVHINPIVVTQLIPRVFVLFYIDRSIRPSFL